MIEQPHGLVATLPGDERALSAESVPLTGVRIDVTARGTASAVSVAQRYVNREKVPVEAVYSFPLEEQAAVCGFEAQIGERRIVGRVEDAEAAFEAYDEAMAEGHGAYLLDEDRPNLFTASIGNLLPGQQAVVTVRYVAPLERLGERIRLKIPTTVAPRYVPAAQLRRMDPAEFDHLCPPMVAGGVPYGLALAIDFEGASDVLAVECASHPAQVRVEGPRAHVELSGADVQLDQDVVVSFELAEAGATTAQAARDEQGDIVVMLDVLPPGDERRAPVEAIFLLDRSGSMTGSSIEQARNALLLALGALEYRDLFNVYGFGSDFESIFPAPAPYDDVHLDEARRAVRGWDADLGGTELLRPLQEIVGRPAGELPRRVLLLTDGEVGNEEECADLVGKHPGTTVFTIGIGYGASDYLVGTLARASHGRAETVHPNERIEPVVMRQMARLRTAGLRDVRVDWTGLAVDLAAPAALPPLYPGTPLTVYGRVPAAAVGPGGVFEPAVVATGPDGPVRLAATVDLRGAQPDEAIPRLFAREAIRDLEEGRAASGHHGSRQRARTQKRVDEAVRDLATRYTLMSSQTSFVAVEVREGEAADLPAAELRRIPVALLKDWHGVGGMWSGSQTMTMASMMMPAADVAQSAAPPKMARYAGKRAAFAPPPGAGFMPRVDGVAGGPHFDVAWSQDSAPAADPLIALVAGQRADGGWPWSDELLAAFGRTREECLALLAGLGLEPERAGEVAPTLLVLGLLRRDFAGREGEWRLLADKALAWLSGRGVAPLVEGRPLEEWVAARLAV